MGARNEYQKKLLLSGLVGTCIMFGPGTNSGEYVVGTLVLDQAPPILPVATPQTQLMQVNFVMEVDDHLTRRIEEMRSGGDLRVRIILHMVCLAINEQQASASMGEPMMETVNVSSWDHSLQIRIPQTDWLRRLEALGYGRYTVFEIETPPPPMSAVLAEAVENLTQAQRLFNEGNYEESMVRCRVAVESAVNKFEAKAGRSLKDVLGSGSRAEFLRGLSSKMKEFMGSAAHATEEPTIPEPKNREDARLAIITSYAAVAYVASFLSQSIR